jgi:hypothetical protein
LDIRTLRAELEKLTSPSSEVLTAIRAKYSQFPSDARESFVTHELARRLNELKFIDPNLQDATIRLGNGTVSFSFIAGWHLVRCGLSGAIDNGVKWFEKICNLKAATVLEVMPLRGIEIAESIQLYDNVELVPFESLSESSQKRSLQMPFQGPLNTPGYAWKAPTSALVAKWSIDPLFCKDEPDIKSLLVGDIDLLRTIRLCLSIISPSCIIPTISWYQYEDADLDIPDLATGFLMTCSP